MTGRTKYPPEELMVAPMIIIIIKGIIQSVFLISDWKRSEGEVKAMIIGDRIPVCSFVLG